MPDDKSFDQYLEHRAEQLGLPTDPEAYQDGGLTVVTSSSVLSQAETIVALLRASGVPAWVKAPLATLAVAEPLLFSVLVPANSRPEAQRLLAEHASSRAPASEKSAEETTDKTNDKLSTLGHSILLPIDMPEYIMLVGISLFVAGSY